MSTILILRVFLSDMPSEVWADRKLLEKETRGYIAWRGGDFRAAMQLLRAAVTGSLESPPIFEVLEILGCDEVLGRLDDVLSEEERRKTLIVGTEPWLNARPGL